MSETFPALPEEPKQAVTDILRYTMLLYGREKIGKTVYLSSFPDALFLTTEPGTKGLRIYEYNAENGGCRTWDAVRAAAGLLEKTDRFKTVVFDTVDRAYDICLEWVCKHRGIEYPGTDEDGREDYGKSWKAVKQEFMGVVHRIIQSGRGVCFTSHAKEQEVRTRSGDRYTRIFPSMSGQARSVVEALVDMFFYAEYVRTPGGDARRVIITQGDEVVWAGCREVGGGIPRFLPMTKTGGFDILQAAFNGEDVGLDPKTFLPARTASEAVKKFFRKAQMEPETRKEVRGRKPMRRRRSR